MSEPAAARRWLAALRSLRPSSKAAECLATLQSPTFLPEEVARADFVSQDGGLGKCWHSTYNALCEESIVKGLLALPNSRTLGVRENEAADADDDRGADDLAVKQEAFAAAVEAGVRWATLESDFAAEAVQMATVTVRTAVLGESATIAAAVWVYADVGERPGRKSSVKEMNWQVEQFEGVSAFAVETKGRIACPKDVDDRSCRCPSASSALGHFKLRENDVVYLGRHPGREKSSGSALLAVLPRATDATPRGREIIDTLRASKRLCTEEVEGHLLANRLVLALKVKRAAELIDTLRQEAKLESRPLAFKDIQPHLPLTNLAPTLCAAVQFAGMGEPLSR